MSDQDEPHDSLVSRQTRRGRVNHFTGFASAVLSHRETRRNWLGVALAIALLMLAAGLWWIDGWLEENLLRFSAFWAACAAVTMFVMIFALYDALAVFREESGKR